MINVGNNAEIPYLAQITHLVDTLAKTGKEWYNILMQFKVPQDVLRPDKIVSFLTLRQLIIVGIGAGMSYSLYMVLSKQYFVEIWLPPVVVVSVITLAFAFFKFHDITFERLILVFIEYKFRPHARTWQKMKGDAVLSVLTQLHPQTALQTKEKALTDMERRKKLEEISRLVDTHGQKMLNIKK